MKTPLFLLILASTTPFTIYLLGALNYYSDYIGSFFSPDASNEVFDFIIVGSGSAGAVVALRLSKTYKVLLLEAGGDPSILNSIPGLALDVLGYPETDWMYKTVPQKSGGFGLVNNQISVNRGKCLGGSSSLNYMLYLRGHPLDYDHWANVTGDPSWKYENILPFFKKSIAEYRGEFKNNKKHYEDSPYGFLTIEKQRFVPHLNTFIEAGQELKFNKIDANGPQTQGFGSIDVNQNKGERMGTYASILKNLGNRKNIRILKYSQATKIKLDKNGRALGVWYYQHGRKKYSAASKEVILSAGSIDSPKLLMLSGIGPKKHLKSIGIKPKVDLPVGQNYQDHFGFFLFPFLLKNLSTLVLERDVQISAFSDYFMKGLGPLTTPSALCGQAFFSTSDQKKTGLDWPNIQMFFMPISVTPLLKDALVRTLNLDRNMMDGLVNPHKDQGSFILLPILVRPKSFGELTLKDKNPFSDPLIDPRVFSHPDDVKDLIEASNFGLNLVENTKAFQKLGAKFTTMSHPNCTQHKFRSSEYWDCYIRHNAGSIWHPVGTCRMGRDRSDPKAVVDSKLRVFGTTGLRVVDSSIQIDIVNANTNAPAIMIGEKGSDSILDYWAKQHLVSDLRHHTFHSDRRKCFYSNY